MKITIMEKNKEELIIVDSRKTLAALIAEIAKAEEQGEPVVLQVVAQS